MKTTLHHLWRVAKTPLRIVAGIVLILLGVTGLILPIMPGWVFILPGVTMLAPNTPLSRWLKKKTRHLAQRVSARRHARQPKR